MMVIADHTNDAAVAEAAVKQVETAYETTLSDGQEQLSGYYQEQRQRARRERRHPKASITGRASPP
jgi:hypothetical protein